MRANPKKLFLKSCSNLIKNNKPKISSADLKKINYGLEAFFLLFSKLIIIVIFSYLFKTISETSLLLVLFGIIRSTGFGIHALNSKICLTVSIIFFNIIPAIIKSVSISTPILLIMSFFCIIIFIKYAPADTEKRPLIKAKQRLYLKLLTITNSIIYSVLLLIIKNNILQKMICLSLIFEGVLILPILYK